MPLSDSSVHPSQDLPGLAMSRAFGDTIAASAGVIAEPEISKHDTSNKDKFIVSELDNIPVTRTQILPAGVEPTTYGS